MRGWGTNASCRQTTNGRSKAEYCAVTYVLSAHAFKRLADNNQLSLVLRYLWQKQDTKQVDPLNAVRADVRLSNAIIVICICFPATVLVGIVWAFSSLVGLSEYHDELLGASLALMLVGGVTTSIYAGGEYVSGEFRQYVSKFLLLLSSNLGEDLETKSAFIALYDLQLLQSLAKSLLADVAEKLLEHDADKPATDDFDPEWNHVKAALDEAMADRYQTLERLGLVQGDYKHFFDLAKKRLEVKAAHPHGQKTP